MVQNIVPDEVADCRGLVCPMPLLKTKKAMGKMKSGQVLEVKSTDPGTGNDLQAFVEKAGHELIGSRQESEYTSFFIKIK